MADIQNSVTQGVALYEQKRYKDALYFFTSIDTDTIERTDENALYLSDAIYYTGLCYSRLGFYEDALNYLEQVVTDSKEESPRVLQCRFILAIIYSSSNRKSLATFELNKLLESGFMVAKVYAALAHLSYLDGKVADCLDYYEKALSIENENVTALNGLGYVLAEADQDLAKALSYCKKASDIAPDAANFDSLGWVYHKLGMDEQAKTYLAKAIMINNGPAKVTMKEEIKKHMKVISDGESR